MKLSPAIGVDQPTSAMIVDLETIIQHGELLLGGCCGKMTVRLQSVWEECTRMVKILDLMINKL